MLKDSLWFLSLIKSFFGSSVKIPFRIVFLWDADSNAVLVKGRNLGALSIANGLLMEWTGVPNFQVRLVREQLPYEVAYVQLQVDYCLAADFFFQISSKPWNIPKEDM